MKSYFIPFMATGMLAFAINHVYYANQTLLAPPPPVEPPRAPYEQTLAASGIVEARTENIAVGSPLSGVVAEVLVKAGQRVPHGTPLFRLDDRQLTAELQVQQANLVIAEAQWTRQESLPRTEEVPITEAKVREAQANLTAQEDLLKRVQALYSRRVMSEESFIQQQQTCRSAREQLARAHAELALLRAGAWKIDRTIAQVTVDHARAQVDQARTELQRLRVDAPVDGDILQVNVRPGEFVGAPPGQALIVLGDLRRLHVRVDIAEQEIPRFRPEAPARATLRGAPGRRFPLEFVRVEPYVVPKRSLTGDGSERVDTRVLQVIYALDRGDEPVYVGQQLDVFLEAAPDGRGLSQESETADQTSLHP
jgi:multidrug resistance efflux pump